MMAGLLTIKNESNERRTSKISDNSPDRANDKTVSHDVTFFDLAVLVFSVFSIFVDLCTDLVLVIQYSNQGFKSWAVGTFLLIFFPSVVVQFFSLRWHVVDNTASVLHWVLHFCMLGIVHRYVEIIKAAFAAFKSKKSCDIQKVFLDQSDLCMLHLIESFLESAPQLVLQMYVIAILHEWRFWTGFSALASLLSLAWALAAYTKAQRRARANKNVTTWPGLLLQAIWRTGMLTSRISTLVLAAYCFGNYIFLLVAIHWLGMTVWIIHQKTDFCETDWEEKIYNAVVGVIYCFCFFNLKEGRSRWRALAFYLVIVFQNLACLTIFLMWFGEKAPKLAVSGFIAIVGGILFGSTGMLCYYRFFHPSGPIKFVLFPQFASTEDTSPCYSSLTLRSLKRIRCESQTDCPRETTHHADTNPDSHNKTVLSDSVVIIEENQLDDSDGDIKILRNWLNEGSCKGGAAGEVSEEGSNETEADAYKRRAICSSVDLVKLLKSKAKPENESLKLSADEASSEILSAHDYENLCAVNIAREAWGLRSWRGYSDIETWLHDDSVVHDRRLDTLTSTTSSDVSANTFPKESEAREDDYIEAMAEDLARCESETSSYSGQYSMDSFPTFYTLGTLDPIFEEIEESSTNDSDLADSKTRNGSASTLVATIDEIRMNTPVQSRYRPPEGIYDRFPVLSDMKPKCHKSWKKVTFASKLMTFPESRTESLKEIKETDHLDKQNPAPPESRKLTEHQDKAEEKEQFKPENMTSAAMKKAFDEKNQNPGVETCDKENVPTVASKINHWNRIINTHNEKVDLGKQVFVPAKPSDSKKLNFC